MNTTYALATLTESQVTDALAAHGTASNPVQAIKVGDVVLCGLGTLQITYREVTNVSIQRGYHNLFHVVTFADGSYISETPNGFWHQVLKMDRARAEAAAATANAYATAWDRRR